MSPLPPTALVLERIVPLSPAQLWKGWTDAAILTKWFTPAPWITQEAEVEASPGGIFRTVMCGPGGERNEGSGCVLDAVEDQRFVWTSALGPGFRPVVANEGFLFTAILEFAPTSDGTMYRATARHSTAADAASHADMGFEAGWSAALDQLVELFL